MTEREALKLALEALEQLDGIDTETECVTIDVGDVITAIKEALAQTEHLREENERLHVENRRLIDRIETMGVPVGVGGFATTTTQPEQEPVAWANPHDLQNFDMKVRTNGGPLHTVPLYTTPPQRTWVGLTADELNMIGDRMRTWNSHSLADVYVAIEAKLKEKNT